MMPLAPLPRLFATRLALALPLVALVAGVACDKGESSGGSAASTSSSAAAEPASASARASAVVSAPPAAPPKAPTRRHAGLAGLLLRGAFDLPTLTDTQREAMQKLEDAPPPAGGDAGAAEAQTPWAAKKAFQTDLVTGIRAAKLDNAKLQADYALLDRTAQAALAQETAALDGLHGILDPAQRQALVDQVKARRPPHMPPPMTAPDGGAPDLAKKRLARLTMELTLDDAQQKSVAAVIARGEPMTPASLQARRDASQKRVDTMLAEFAKDPFSAKKLDLSFGGKTPHESEEQQAALVGGILPVLHPDQREKLAVRTERMGSRPMRNMDDSESAMPFGADDEMPLIPRLR